MSTDSSLFCDTCLKNQHISTQILSEYLPASDSPDYGEKEASYPQFRKELDDRYPPVCLNCEPRVRERLQQQQYVAKTDHLRRLMDRTKQRRIAHRWGWRNLIVRAGGLGQLVSGLTYFCWELAVILSGLREQAHTLDPPSQRSVQRCAGSIGRVEQISPACLSLFSDIAGWGLLLGLITAWWNPKWQYKLQGNFGRLRGLSQYYRLQAIVLLVRSGVWACCRGIGMEASKMVWALHVVASPLLLFVVFAMWKSIQIEVSPIKSWQTEIPPLIQPGSLTSVPLPAREQATSRFPVASLGNNQTEERSFEAPPSSNVEASDSMEWEPSGGQNFRPTSYADRYAQRSAQPSPFHGRLPPAPTNHFLKRDAQNLPPPRESIGLAPGHFDRPQMHPENTPSSPAIDFAQPKFFPPNDLELDTGLESVFNQVFSLDSDTARSAPRNPGSSAPGPSQQYSRARHVISPATRWRHLVQAFILACLLIVWLSAHFQGSSGQDTQMVIITLTAFGAPLLCYKTFNAPDKQNHEFAIQVLCSICSAYVCAHRMFEGSTGGMLDHVITATLFVTIVQEAILCTLTPPTLPSDTFAPASSGTLHNSNESQGSIFQASQPAGPKNPALSSETAPIQGQLSPFSPERTFSGRQRTESVDSSNSDSDASSVRTLRLRSNDRGQSPGIALGSLRLDEGTLANTPKSFGTRNLRSSAFSPAGGYGRNY